MEGKNNKNNKTRIILLVVFFLVAFLLIGVGVYFNKLAAPKNIAGAALDRLSYLFNNYMEKDEDFYLGDNFTLESDIDFNIESEYYKAQSKVDYNALQVFKLLNNLNNLETKVTIKQNADSKKAFFQLVGNLGKEKLINAKYLVDNATEYYFVEGFLNTYVNNGSCNYFESFDEENNTRKNMEYLYTFILGSLKNNLKEEYFEKSSIKTNISGNSEEVNLVAMKINNKIYKEILKGVLNDLKSDERANKILTSMDEDFSKTKIKENKVYLKSNESYTVNIYTTKLLNKHLKTEIVHTSDLKKQTISYEGNDNEGNIYLIDNGKVIYAVDCKFSDNKYEFRIKDSGDKEDGTLKLEFNSKSKSISFTANEDNMKLDLVYVSKNTWTKPKSKYTNEQKITFKVMENMMSKFNGNVTIVTKVSDEASIKEDASNAVLKSTITDAQKEVLNSKVINVMQRLTR